MGKLPPQAKQVFNGQIFDVYQWEQPMFDGTVATFEMLKRPNTVQIIAVVGDTIIINKESQPHKGDFLTLPGGRQDATDATMREAAKRELLEETGYTSDDMEELYTWSPYNKMEWTVSCFVARNAQKVQSPMLDPGEKIDLLFLSFDEFIHLASSVEFHATELKEHILRMRLNPPELEHFKKILFS